MASSEPTIRSDYRGRMGRLDLAIRSRLTQGVPKFSRRFANVQGARRATIRRACTLRHVENATQRAAKRSLESTNRSRCRILARGRRLSSPLRVCTPMRVEASSYAATPSRPDFLFFIAIPFLFPDTSERRNHTPPTTPNYPPNTLITYRFRKRRRRANYPALVRTSKPRF